MHLSDGSHPSCGSQIVKQINLEATPRQCAPRLKHRFVQYSCSEDSGQLTARRRSDALFANKQVRSAWFASWEGGKWLHETYAPGEFEADEALPCPQDARSGS
jgi:hypothetical protein